MPVLSRAVCAVRPGAVYTRYIFAGLEQEPLSGGEPVLDTLPGRVAGFPYNFCKRVVDLTLSAASLILFAPVMLSVGVFIGLRSGRPVILAQERIGHAGRRFLLFKFRTLPVATLAGSDREWTAAPAERWGRFLRETGLDELPQLWNVLRGDMSLVGPRPERPYFVAQFLRELPVYSNRHYLVAGITGWAQVHGCRGDTSIARRVEHDLYYLRHWSLGLDFRILWMTLKDFARHLWPWVSTEPGVSDDRSV